MVDGSGHIKTYANAHRGKVRKASLSPSVLRMAEQEEKCIPSKGWAEMIRKVYEVDPMVCPKCGGVMKVVAFITDYRAVDRIIDHLKLMFVAEKPPPSHVFEEVALMAAEERTDLRRRGFQGLRRSIVFRQVFRSSATKMSPAG